MVNLGARLRALRLEKHMTQSAVAQRVGATKAMISSYELEQRTPSYEVLIKLAALFNVTTDYLLGVEKVVVNYNGLTDREIRAVVNIIEILRDK